MRGTDYLQQGDISTMIAPLKNIFHHVPLDLMNDHMIGHLILMGHLISTKNDHLILTGYLNLTNHMISQDPLISSDPLTITNLVGFTTVMILDILPLPLHFTMTTLLIISGPPTTTLTIIIYRWTIMRGNLTSPPITGGKNITTRAPLKTIKKDYPYFLHH